MLYRDFWGVRKRAAYRADEGEYAPLAPSAALGFPFRPRAVEAVYLSLPRLPELVPTSFPGVTTSRDALLVDIDRGRLERRMRDYFDPKVPDRQVEETTPGTMVKTNRYDATDIRRRLQRRGIDPEGIRRYTYRPFDVRWLYWEGETKLLDEKRAEYATHVSLGNLFIQAREKDVAPKGQRATVSGVLSDSAGNGISSWFPLMLAPKAGAQTVQGVLLGGEEDDTPTVEFNLSPLALDALRAHGLEGEPETVFYHALAVMHAPAYAAENAGALRQDWPRVPISLPSSWGAGGVGSGADTDPETPTLPSPEGEGSQTRGWLLRGAALGRRMAALLDIETPVARIETGDVAEGLRSVARYAMTDGATPRERTDDVALRSRWGYRGQGGVVMPGPDSSIEDPTPAPPQGEGFASPTRYVPANAKAGWTGVPEAVWNYHLGGYQVLKKWLSYREEAILGRPLTLEEVRTFTAICRRIAALLALGPELDAHYRAAAGDPVEAG